MAWHDHKLAQAQAEQAIQATTRVFQHHAQNVFETHKLVARMVNEHIRAMSWEDIAASSALHRYLVDVVREYPQVHSLWLIDSAGIVRNSSGIFPTPAVSVISSTAPSSSAQP